MTERERWEAREAIYAPLREPLESMAAAMDAVEVIGAAILLIERTEGIFTGTCPFCSGIFRSGTKSFHLRAGTGMWHCFHCNSGGTVIKFIQKMCDKVKAESEKAITEAGL